MNHPEPKRVAIIGGTRIPFCRSHTAYAKRSNQEMMTTTLDALIGQFNLAGAELGDVSLGAVIKHSHDWNLARECVLGTALAPTTPAFDLQRACGTSLEAAIILGAKIALGQIDSGIAGGTDTISDPPVVYPDNYRRMLLNSARGQSLGAKLKPWLGLRPSMFKPGFPGVIEPQTGLSMGQSTELTAKAWNISRAEQDELALTSHKNATAAWEEGFYEGLVVPYSGATTDNNIRPDTSLEKLAKLKPVFDKGPDGTLTAGNSSTLTDGASAVLLASEEWAAARDLPVLAYLSYGKVAGIDFINRDKDGLLLAPVFAVNNMLQDAGLGLDEFDFYEIHEAFAAQALATMKAWADPEFCRERLGRDGALGVIDRSKLNIKGGSVAIGHPFAATGGRLLASLAKMIDLAHGGRGLISVCTAGGMGVTAILEK